MGKLYLAKTKKIEKLSRREQEELVFDLVFELGLHAVAENWQSQHSFAAGQLAEDRRALELPVALLPDRYPLDAPFNQERASNRSCVSCVYPTQCGVYASEDLRSPSCSNDESLL